MAFFEQQNDSALYFADKGIAYSKKNNLVVGEIENLEVKGVYLEEVKNDYDEATRLYFEAIAIAQQEAPKYVSSLYNNLCILFLTLEDYQKAAEYGHKAVAASTIIQGTRSEAKAYVNLGIAQSLLGDYEAAQKTFDYFLALPVLTTFEKNIANLRIAKNLREQGRFQEAEPLLLQVIAMDSLKGQREYNIDYATLIENFIDTKNEARINQYLPLLQKSFYKEKNLDQLKGYFETLSKAHTFLNQTTLALRYKDSLLLISDSLNQKRYNKNIIELETAFKTKEKEALIDAAKKRQKLWYVIAFSIGAGLLLVSVLLINNSKKRKALAKNKMALEKSLKQRNMLLRETHHRVKNSFQMVSGLLQLQAMESKAKDAVLALDAAVQRVNSMILLHQQLYAKDDLLGVELQKYLTDLTDEFLQTSTRKVTFHHHISETIVNIDTATSIGLLVNELATNSIKYAQPLQEPVTVHLSIDLNENTLSFKMYDSGVVIPSDIDHKGYGSELTEVLVDRLDARQTKNTEKPFGVYLEIPLNTMMDA